MRSTMPRGRNLPRGGPTPTAMVPISRAAGAATVEPLAKIAIGVAGPIVAASNARAGSTPSSASRCNRSQQGPPICELGSGALDGQQEWCATRLDGVPTQR